jgi:alkylation response protein AidB-like acyl-CoA dehydrogenase
MKRNLFPRDLFHKMGELGFMGVYIPEVYNGSGFSYFEYVTVVSEIAKVCGSIGLVVAAHNSLCTGHIYYHGTEEQKEKIFTQAGQWRMDWCLGTHRSQHRQRCYAHESAPPKK